VGTLTTHHRAPRRISDRDRRLLDLHARHAADLIERLRFERALQEADRRKDEFLATLAHELRNPLAPIRNAVQILQAKATSDADVIWSRDVIERQVGQMARLLDDLLDVSRISRNRFELHRARVTLAAVLDDAVETSRPLIEAGGHELVVALEELPVYLDADPVRLAQVFANLLNNAAKYTPDPGCIRLAARRDGPHVIVSVSDTGIGIAPEMLTQVFEMFSQVESAQTRSRGGLGIGLSLARRVVEMHGGRIEARSEGPGKGSEFAVWLPVVAEEIVAAAADTSAPAARGAARLRFLVVDDARDNADTLAKLLRVMGHEAHVAYGGAEAVAATESLRPDGIVLDIGMPGMDGFEACRRIRASSWGRRARIVALTGWGQEHDRRGSAEAGFDAHLVKPIDPALLLEALTRAS
jgi:signal transduction histidine kinase/CheY-like chemotaxis protein